MAVLKSFVRENPSAVFVRAYPYRSFEAIEADDGFHRGGYEAVEALFTEGEGTHRELLIKPNLTVGVSPELAANPAYHGGITTHPRFIAGLCDGLLERGERCLTVVEGGIGLGVSVYAQTGYFAMMSEVVGEGPGAATREMRGVRLLWASKHRFEDFREDEITWVPVPNGVVHREIPVVTPFRKPGTALINAPTLKTHNLAVTTLCCKALQGMVAQGYKHFCASLSAYDDPRAYPPEVLAHFQADFRERVLHEHARHCAMGLPYWSSNPDPVYGVGRFECWAQRTADMLSAFQPFEEHFLLNVVEGIIGRNGTAFSQGEDVPVGLVVAGINPVHVDAIASLLMGHDPQVIPYLVVARERGLGESDPTRIPVFRLPERTPLTVEELQEMAVPLPVFLHGDASRPLLFRQ